MVGVGVTSGVVTEEEVGVVMEGGKGVRFLN